MRDYEIIEASNELIKRYDILRSCYDHMINGYENK